MLKIDSLRKVFPGSEGRAPTKALDGVSFTVEEGAFFTLLGPSGCGKTTTLQCIAGLEAPDSGTIRMGDTVVFSGSERILIPSNKRRLGMVFQSYAIWPHMSVFDNVAFPLVHGSRRPPMAEVRREVAKALEMVELGHLSDRPAPMLSGGQQQRVALARALVHQPRLLLLDEPLSNLDAKLRDTMRTEIRNLVKSVGITTLFVTHDQVEAVGMSDQIVLMRGGSIVQQGTPREIYLHPNSVFTADFMGRSNLVPGRVMAGGSTGRIEVPFGELAGTVASGLQAGDRAVAVIRPQAVELLSEADSTSRENCFSARITSLSFLGDVVETEIDAGGQKLVLMLNPYAGYEPGQEIFLHVPADRCAIVPADTTEQSQ
ncbi:ABC transporter ATP-binding protein [Microbaculum marinisediminis]|uniref:ABC transporter ATP-binding protein n=1 Tax=Microbaculum marinisediminis TaxID=2931392 RepID=A0AAW5R0G2_9HYPH|nr:ABC transporter ATP-binding protein [Microbaculum sp. A6E488]MCT8973770.1 ABC transporter ATP-binding protein [Microbaculum sp. A6E488]